MAKKLYPEEAIQNIAVAIREKNGTSATYKVHEMRAAILAIAGELFPPPSPCGKDFERENERSKIKRRKISISPPC